MGDEIAFVDVASLLDRHKIFAVLRYVRQSVIEMLVDVVKRDPLAFVDEYAVVSSEIAFVDVASLLDRGRAKIVESKLVNETTIRLKLDDMSNAVRLRGANLQLFITRFSLSCATYANP